MSKYNQLIKKKDVQFGELLHKIGNLINTDGGNLQLSRDAITYDHASKSFIRNVKLPYSNLTITQLNSLYILAFYNEVITISELRTLLLDETCNFKDKIYATKNTEVEEDTTYYEICCGVIINIIKD